MADDENDTKKVGVISEGDQQVEELRQSISQKFALIQQRMEKQNEQLKGVQAQLEQQLAQKSGGDR